jgi:hypothetical protein
VLAKHINGTQYGPSYVSENEIFASKENQEIPFLKYELDIHVTIQCTTVGCFLKKSFPLIHITAIRSIGL